MQNISHVSVASLTALPVPYKEKHKSRAFLTLHLNFIIIVYKVQLVYVGRCCSNPPKDGSFDEIGR